MELHWTPTTARVSRPAYVWIAVALELMTAIGAIPVGLMFIADPTGQLVQVPRGWIDATFFGSYLVPGLYLVLVQRLRDARPRGPGGPAAPGSAVVALFWLRATGQLRLWQEPASRAPGMSREPSRAR